MAPFFNGRSGFDLRNRWSRLQSDTVDDGTRFVYEGRDDMGGSGVGGKEERELEVVEAPDPKIRRGRFTAEEDAAIIGAKKSDPWASWKEIAKRVPGRTARQCLRRWFNWLSPKGRPEPWTPEEDELLVEKVNEMGRTWTAMTRFFEGRSAMEITNRWRHHVRYRTADDSTKLIYIGKKPSFPETGGREANGIDIRRKEALFSVTQKEKAPEVGSSSATTDWIWPKAPTYRRPFTPDEDTVILRARIGGTYSVFQSGVKTWTRHTPRGA
jgi:hypothetical protein